MKRPNKPPVEVSQLQTIKWADLTAPDDTKILRDLVQKSQDLNTSQSPILVHCSAGVGRTGTFIAVYKLVSDYQDSKKENIEPYSTVLEMRQCRMKMVQKKEQYAYIFKCLRDEIKSEEGGYYHPCQRMVGPPTCDRADDMQHTHWFHPMCPVWLLLGS